MGSMGSPGTELGAVSGADAVHEAVASTTRRRARPLFVAGASRCERPDPMAQPLDALLEHEGWEAPPRVLRGTYLPGPAETALAPLCAALRQEFQEEPTSDAVRRLTDATARRAARVAALIDGGTPEEGAAPLSLEAAARWIGSLLRALGEERPSIVALGELHLAPASDLNLVAALARELAGARTLLLLCGDPDPIADWVYGLASSTSLLRVESPRQDAAPAVDPMRGMDPQDVRLLGVAALSGARFTPELVGSALDVEASEVRVRFELWARPGGPLRRCDDAFAFVGGSPRRHAVNFLSESERARVSELLAGAWLREFESEEQEPPPALGVRLCRALIASGWSHRALPWIDAALDRLESFYLFSDAQDLLHRLLEDPAIEDEDRARLHLREAAFLRKDDRFEEQREALALAAAAAERIKDFARAGEARRALGEAFVLAGMWDEANDALYCAKDWARRCTSVLDEARCERAFAELALRMGRAEEARSRLLDALALSQQVEDDVGQAEVLGSLGHIEFSHGRYPQARRHYEAQLEKLRIAGPEQFAAVPTGNLANVFLALGHFDKALGLYGHALRLTREGGDRRGQCLVSANLSQLYLRMGMLDRAEELTADLRELATQSRDPHGQAMADALRARLEEMREHMDAAAELYEAARQGFADVGAEEDEADCWLSLGRIYLAQEQPEKAETHLDEALTRGRRLGLSGITCLADAHRARLPGRPGTEARKTLIELQASLLAHQRMEARYALWLATKEIGHLEVAHYILAYIQRNTPADFQKSMMQAVPLHRQVQESWIRHRAQRGAAVRDRSS